MKLIFSLVLMCFSSHGRSYFLIKHKRDLDRARIVEKLLIHNFNIPATMVTVKPSEGPCIKENGIIFQVCLDEGKEVAFPTINRKMIRRLRPLWEN